MIQRSFSKMHGLGNDFVVFDATREPLNLAADQLRLLADRRLGVGCDQILALEPAQRPDADYFYRIYNADGSESGQCGNGARCLARFLREQRIDDRDRIVVQTRSGLMTLEWLAADSIAVEMGVPVFDPAAIPLDVSAPAPDYEIGLAGDETVMAQSLAVGNPHAVITVADVSVAPVHDWGPQIESHALFPERVNVGFMQIIDAGNIALRVFERGAGETRACGSGACAAVIAGRLSAGLEPRVQVRLPGGTLTVEWQGENQPVYLIGGATHVYTGKILL